MSEIEWKAMQAAREEARKEDAVKLLALGVEPEKISEAMDLLGPTAT